jgi:hypothetical protein
MYNVLTSPFLFLDVFTPRTFLAFSRNRDKINLCTTCMNLWYFSAPAQAATSIFQSSCISKREKQGKSEVILRKMQINIRRGLFLQHVKPL